MIDQAIQILLIEDNPTDALLVDELLSQVRTTRFKLTSTERLAESLTRLSQEVFEVVLLDLSLPDSQGLETLLKIQEHSPQIPVVVLTGLTDEALGLRALQEGAQDYVVKGQLDSSELARTIRYAIERKRSEAEIIKRNQELLTLQSAGAAIASSLRLDDVYYALAHHTRRLFSYDCIAVTLLDTDGLRVAYALPQPHAGFSVGARLPLNGSAAGWVVSKGQPLLRHQLSAEIRFVEDEGLAAESIESSLILPLRSKGKIIGTWNLGCRQISAYSPDNLPMAQALAAQLAIAIENAHLYRQTQLEVIERRRAEEALRESEERYRILVETSPDAIMLTDLERKILFCNQKTANLFGADSATEILGRTVFEWIAPEDLERATKNVSEILKRGSLNNIKYTLVKKNGARFPSELNTSILLDRAGKPQGFTTVIRDITERQQLEVQLQQSQKMEAIGRLAGGIAHDFNNLLLVIIGYSQLILNRPLSDDDPLRSYIEEINHAGERAAGLTRQLLAFSRKQVLEPKILNLNKVVADMDKMLRRLIGEDIDLITTLSEELGQMKADPGQLEQVIMNLAINARDAMPEGGKLTIETANVELDETYASEHLEAQPGPYVMLAVSDTGTGMDQETLSRIFEPFFTTKAQGKGTGLGLSTLYGIVKQSDGHLWVYSEVGHGTTFKVYLPRVEEAVTAVEPARPFASRPHTMETILLVEDEERVRELVRALLEEEGYSVWVARNGEEALKLCQRSDSSAHLLVTDIVMPGGMNGRQLVEYLSPHYPQLKILYMSGYTDEAIVHHGILTHDAAFIQKPFSLAGLIRKVREILDEPLES